MDWRRRGFWVRLLCAACMSLVLHSAAADPTLDAAQQAQQDLVRATEQLIDAQSAQDRVAALSATVRAYEQGLAALRDGMRRVALREAELSRSFNDQAAEIGKLLGAIQIIEHTPRPLLLMHPDGPLGGARAAGLMADVTPALQARAQELKAEMDELAALRAYQTEVQAVMHDGLQGAREARLQLSQAVSERSGSLPRRFADNSVQTALLIANAQNMAQFARFLADNQHRDAGLPPSSAVKGRMILPVEGEIVQGFQPPGAPPNDLPRQSGLTIATLPRSLVSIPVAATLRFKGPLLDYGNVMILEPATDILVILAGIGETFGEVGEVMPSGAPLGLMGGQAPTQLSSVDEIVKIEASATASQRLYIEIRQAGRPVDPAEWFVFEE